MHRITLYFAGKPSAFHYHELTKDYLKRLEKWAKVNIINSVMQLSKSTDYLICLDSRGENLTTESLAKNLKNCIDIGRSISVIVGDAYGIDESIIEKADLVLAFGSTTFPHELVRLMISEQLYRSFSVIHGSKYHHA